MYMRWSTAEIEPHRRREFATDAICESYLLMSLDLQHAAARSMHFTLESYNLDTLGMVKTRCDATGRTLRTAAHVARQPGDSLFFNINLGPAHRIRHGEREYVCQNNEAVLLSSTHSLDMSWNGSEVVSLVVPSRAFGDSMGHALRRLAQQLRPSAPLDMLSSQVLALARWNGEIPIGQAIVIADSLISLLRCVLVEDVHEGADARDGRHLTRRIRAFVADAYADPSVTPQHAALDLGVPVRTLHDALARDGETFMSLLMAYRLRCAHSLLMCHREHVRIADISLRCGFRSASHFTRRFKERYGLSPSALASRA